MRNVRTSELEARDEAAEGRARNPGSSERRGQSLKAFKHGSDMIRYVFLCQ